MKHAPLGRVFFRESSLSPPYAAALPQLNSFQSVELVIEMLCEKKKGGFNFVSCLISIFSCEKNTFLNSKVRNLQFSVNSVSYHEFASIKLNCFVCLWFERWSLSSGILLSFWFCVSNSSVDLRGGVPDVTTRATYNPFLQALVSSRTGMALSSPAWITEWYAWSCPEILNLL